MGFAQLRSRKFLWHFVFSKRELCKTDCLLATREVINIDFLNRQSKILGQFILGVRSKEGEGTVYVEQERLLEIDCGD